MFDSFSDFVDSSPLDGLLMRNKSVLDEINKDIFTDINLHAPASRISVTIDNNNSGNLQLNTLSSMVLTITHNNTIIPIGPLYENINTNALGYNNSVIITNPNIIDAFKNAPRGYQFNLSIKYTYTYTFTYYNSNVESTVNYGSYIPNPNP